MFTSKVSIIANPSTTRRRLFSTFEASPMSNAIEVTRDSDSRATTKPYQSSRKGGVSVKPQWKIMSSVVTKHMLPLVILAGLVQMVCIFYLSKVHVVPGYDELDRRIAEVEVFVSKSMSMMQVQVDVVDTKVVRLDEKVGGMESEVEKLGRGAEELGGRAESLVKYLSGNELLSKPEFHEFFEEYKKAKGDVDYDHMRMVARDIVMNEIERHVADGLGRVDYALAAAGGYVTRHSKARGGIWFSGIGWNGVHFDSVKMLRPSFGEPGDCFALNGTTGFVEIKLKKAIVPEAVTLEHVSKSVAYSRSSAPKDCTVSGWFRGQEVLNLNVAEKKFPLAEFTYDLEKSNAQTFDISQQAGSGIVDMIRLDFTSNHGSASYTCIYRFRVHGHEPDSFVPMAKKF